MSAASKEQVAKITEFKTSIEMADAITDAGSTVHYLSPATLTVTTLHAEDASFSDFYRYMKRPGSDYSGEYGYTYSDKSSASFEIVQLERTCAIIRPYAVYYEDVVVRKILQCGFKILQKRKLQLTPEQVSELYSQQYGTLSFPYLVVSMSAGPVIVMCLAGVGVINKWRDLVRGTGTLNHSWFFPKSMRLRFGVHTNLDNVLHASADTVTANREVRFFFPQTILEPIPRYYPDVTDYLAIFVNPTLLDALTELSKRKPIEPLLFFSEWLLLNNPYQPKLKPEIIKLPT